jgi:hypothetical protein
VDRVTPEDAGLRERVARAAAELLGAFAALGMVSGWHVPPPGHSGDIQPAEPARAGGLGTDD